MPNNKLNLQKIDSNKIVTLGVLSQVELFKRVLNLYLVNTHLKR